MSNNVMIINGPNLNLLGTRETDIYGNKKFDDYLEELKMLFPALEIEYYQSNVEGEIINRLQACTGYKGIVMNAAGYTHTSVAIGDTIAAIKAPVVEVHISNIYAREEFRHVSLTGGKCAGVITGFGLEGYRLALEYLMKRQ